MWGFFFPSLGYNLASEKLEHWVISKWHLLACWQLSWQLSLDAHLHSCSIPCCCPVPKVPLSLSPSNAEALAEATANVQKLNNLTNLQHSHLTNTLQSALIIQSNNQ